MRQKIKRRKKGVLLCLLPVVLLLIIGVWFLMNSGYLPQDKTSDKKNADAVLIEDDKADSEEEQTNDIPELTEREKQINLLVEGMTLEEKVYQMMFVTPEALTGAENVTAVGNQTKEALEEKTVGGVVFFSVNIKSREQITQMISYMQKNTKIPLFIGVDEEGGRVSRLGNANIGITKHPSMKEIGNSGNPENAYNVGVTMGKELKELGFNVDFAPVADILTNSGNTEISDRSFGTNVDIVSSMVARFVTGLEESNVSSTLKHFPGGGSTYVDSHTGYSESLRTIEELRNNEFVAFSEGIKAGADFVMVSHMTPVNVLGDKIPASLSKVIITDYLKNELGFKGIVITDSLSMGAITESYTTQETVVKAVDAGADMLLMPLSLDKAHSAIVSAVKDGTLSEERINESVSKILRLKFSK